MWKETERVLELLRLVTAELITVRTGSEQRLNANKISSFCRATDLGASVPPS